MLFSHNEEKYFTPASNIKLFTFYTGIKLLGDSVPAFEYTIVNDSLIFSGTGDPSFLNPDLPQSAVLDFFKESEEDLYYLPPSYTEKYFGPGWSWDDYNSYYSVERTAFPIYANRVTFSNFPGIELPEAYPAYFQELLILDEDTTAFPRIQRGMTTNEFRYPIKRSSASQDVPFKYSSELFVELLKDTLQKDIKIIEKLPKHADLDRKVYSVPTDSIYKRMMEVSDNFIAEQILLLSANEISDTLKSNIAIEHMKETWLKDLPDEPNWVDGSGLSRYNLVTPRTIVKLLEKIQNEVPREQLFNIMATGGKTGTIRNFYKGDPEPYIFAKTGTLRNNHALSGYLKAKSGKILIFSFMNNNYTIPTSAIRNQMEIILRNIYENY